MLHSRLHLLVPLLRGGQTVECLGIIQKTQCYFGYWRKLVKNVLIIFPFLSPCEISGGQNSTWTCFSRSSSVFSLSVSFDRCSRPIFILTLLIIGRTSEKKPGNTQIMPLFFPTLRNARQKVLTDNFIGLFSSP